MPINFRPNLAARLMSRLHVLYPAFSFSSLTSSLLSPFLQLISSFASQEQKEYASAGAVAEEVLSSIKTVVLFGGESREAER